MRCAVLVGAWLVCAAALWGRCDGVAHARKRPTSRALTPEAGATNFGVTGADVAQVLRGLPTREFDVTQFGAVGDGRTVNTASFARAIAAASSSGGGLVTVRNGTFVIGAIALNSSVYLNVEADAMVVGSGEVSDYPAPWQGIPVLVQANGATNTGIVGGGIVDGGAVPNFVQLYNRSDDRLVPRTWEGTHGCRGECRPRVAEFRSSANVLIRDVTLQNSPDWTLHLHACSNVLVDNATILGDYRFPNNDGVDPDSCVNVTIRNTYIDVGDDGVCLKSSAGMGPLANVLVEDCSIRSRSSAFKIGSATHENIADVLVQRLYIWDSNRGLGIQHRDEGNITNVVLRNIEIAATSFQPTGWWGAAEPIWITTTPRTPDQRTVGTVSNVRVEHVQCELSESGVVIASRSQFPLTNITLLDIQMVLKDWHPQRQSTTYSEPCLDYRPSYEPQLVPVDHVDAFYFENVQHSELLSSTAVFSGEGSWGACVNRTRDAEVFTAEVMCSSA